MKEKIANLTVGQVLLVKAIKTKDSLTGTGYQLEFAEKVQSSGAAGINLLAAFNADDNRFSSGARRGWLKTTIMQASRYLGINLGDDAAWVMNPETGKEELELGILNPEFQGLRMRLQVQESTVPFNDYQAQNVSVAAKRKGKDGEFITHNGKNIFSNVTVVALPANEEPGHVFLKADTVSVRAEIVDETLGGLI